MAKRIYNGECLIKCENCGAVNTAVWKNTLGYKRWVVKNCTKCNRKIDIKRMETVLCPHCGTLVEKDSRNLCLKCGKLVYREDETFTAECTNCGVVNLIPLKHDEEVFCEVCGEKFSADQLKGGVAPDKGPAQNIRLKDQHAMMNEKLIMWKHPLNQFSAKSRLQVSAGTWALLLKNGVCQYPYGPGSYLLEETDLGQKAKLEAAAAGEDVVLNTDIFCVLQNLPEIKWGTGANKIIIQYFLNKDETRDYQIIANGAVSWNVSDAKAFAERFGFRELHNKDLVEVNTVPNTQDAELVSETRKAVHDALQNAAKNIVGLDNLDPLKLMYKQADVEKQLRIELDRIMDGIGLVCGSLKLTEFRVEEDKDSSVTTETNRRDAIRKAAKKDYRWTADGIRLYPSSSQKAYATFAFSGSARMTIEDEERFFDTSEIQNLDEKAGAAENLFKTIISEAVSAEIAPAAQGLISGNRVSIPELYLHTSSLADALKGRIQSRLSAVGLGVGSLYLDQPAYEESDELKHAGEMEERKKKLIRFAEKTINWEVPPVAVHMKDNKGLSANVIFSGNCNFRVTDEDKFFARSEADEFLNSEPFVDEKKVVDYYAEKINGHFAAKLAGVTQNMIDSHDWDVRELPRYTEQLKTPVIDTLNMLISDWGMRVESAYLYNTKVIQSEALLRKGEMETHDAEKQIEVGKRKIDNEAETEIVKSDAEKTKAFDDIGTDMYRHSKDKEIERMDADEKIKDKQADQAVNDINRGSRVKEAVQKDKLKDIDYRTEINVKEVTGAAEVDEAEDKRKAGRTEREYIAENKAQQHMEDLNKAAQDAKHRMEEAEEEHKRTLADIRHQAGLDDAKFRETLNGILHRIDESDLEWQKKLDAYNRLSQQLGVQDAQDARRAAAETDAEIKRMQGKADADVTSMKTVTTFEAGMKGVELTKAQAELQETIDRYAENRDERKQAADFARNERMAILSFEQNLEDRRQKAEEALTTLKEQHAEAQRDREYNTRLAEMKAEIERLRLQLDVEKTRIVEEAGLGKAKSADEGKAKEAEFNYLAQKETERQQREDAMMDRAESLFRYVQSIQTAMDRARMDLQKHSDDNETSVRRDYADVEKIRAMGMNAQERAEIMRKLDDLEREIAHGGRTSGGRYSDDEYEKLMRRIRELMIAIQNNKKGIDDIRSAVGTVVNSRNCWKCGASMPKDSRFCSNCGESLIPGVKQAKKTDSVQPSNGVVCPLCGELNAPGAKRCKCGAELT